VTATLASLDTSNQLTHVYDARGATLAMLKDKSGEVLVSGPAGTGKSRGCLEKMLGCALAGGRYEDGVLVEPSEFRGLMLRKTLKSLTSTTLETWRKRVAKEAIRAGVCKYYGGSASEPAQYKFTNGAAVVIGGMDNPDKIMSSDYDLIFVDEATQLSLDDWQACTTRLRNGAISFQQLIGACNPDRPTHWAMERQKTGTLRVLYSKHWENPVYFDRLSPEDTVTDTDTVEVHGGIRYRRTPAGDAYIGGKLAKLTGVRKLRLLDGKWVAAEGLVYESWDPAVHVPAKRFKIGKDWPRYWVVDFGYRNPFVCQWWAENPDGQLIMYREIYMTGRLVEDHARQIMRQVLRYPAGGDPAAFEDPVRGLKDGRLYWNEPQPVAVICDHDAEGRATLTKHLGRGTVAARKELQRGIQEVEKQLRVQGDGKPGLLFLPDSLVELDITLKEAGKPVCTVDEFGGYVWPSGRPPGKGEWEDPVKENDHGCDLTRYLVAHKYLRRRFVDRDIGLEG
jgi:hypothetical protein